ncbi:MAG TPA: efflux RND transporter periplasmic adaptor subunit [Candidatus Sulfotelmatobacter sp.]|nr:efflux RND transporter periplasmic adaptor subunit [Candidatus Sulfotelmatobacter sp.]
MTALVLAVLVAGCNRGGAGRRGLRGQASPNPIPTTAARETTVRATSTISGVVAPLLNVAITSSLSEPTDVVNVNEGDRIHTGEVLAVLDTADLQAQLAQAQATVVADQRTAESDDAKVAQTRYTATLNIGQGGNSVQSARAAVAQAQQNLTNDQANLARDRLLIANGYIAQQALEQQQTQVLNDQAALRNAQAALQSAILNQNVNGTANQGLQASNVASAVADARAAHAAVAQAQATVRQYQAEISRATIVSPIDGVVINRNLNPGEYPGSRTIFTLQRLDQVYAMLNASSSDTFAIPVGAPVSLVVAGTNSTTYTGKVVAVLGQVTPGSTNFTVKVLVTNADGRLQSGLPVTATASLPPVSGVGIPTTAFLDDTHTTIMIAQDNVVDVVAKTVHVRELGSDGTTSIVSGVKAGQQVVSNGQLGLSDGQSLAEE